MIRKSSDLSLAARQVYDAVIDVRSPGEFAEDHLPGAINLPVLDDQQRAEVGTIYVQQSKFLARRTGAAYVARNIADHLQNALADRESSFRPLVYCWRGGQRSSAMATIMDQVGWPVTQLEGGYQTWRRQVVADLYDGPGPGAAGLDIILLDGYTGSGKTEVLGRLGRHGVQTLDLEGLAEHRGSVFGATGVAQPSQKQFESRLAEAITRLDRRRPIVVEAESSRIGKLTLPPVLWAAMKAARRIELAAPLAARAAHVVQHYDAIGSDAEALDTALGRLPRHHSREAVAGWRALAQGGRLVELVTELMTHHYDPAYSRISSAQRPTLLRAPMDGLSDSDLDLAAIRIADAVLAASGPG